MMKSIMLMGLGLAVLIACNEPDPPQPVITNLTPHVQEVINGGTSDTNIATLGRLELSGTQDQFDKYIEYSPISNILEVIYTYRVQPSSVNATTDFRLSVNYKGPTFTADQWAFEIMRPGTTTWIQVGTNQTAQDWKWTAFTFNLGKMNTVFDTTGAAKIRVRALTGKDNMDLDFLALSCTSCSVISPTPTPTVTATPTVTPTVSPTPTTWWKPSIGMKWDIQFANAVVVRPEIQVYDIDMFDNTPTFIDSLHAQGKKVICYFSGGSSENWRPDFSSFPSSVLGKKLAGWDGERWLDVRQISTLRPIMSNRIAQAKQKGCDAVDADNVDGYTNDTGFPLTATHQLAYNRMLAEEAHKLGMGIGLKNDLNQINDLSSDFDFSINESCFDFNECDMLSPFIAKGKAVFGIQYTIEPSVFCPQAKALGMDFIKKKHELDDWIDPCWNH